MQTRADLEEIVSRGEGVLRNGQVITNVDDLPSDEELAKDYPERAEEFAAAAAAGKAAKASKTDKAVLDENEALKKRIAELEAAAAAGKSGEGDKGDGDKPDGSKGIGQKAIDKP